MLLYGDVNFFFLVKIFAPCSSVSRSMLLESSSTSGVYFSSVGCGLHLRASFSLFSRHLIFFLRLFSYCYSHLSSPSVSCESLSGGRVVCAFAAELNTTRVAFKTRRVLFRRAHPQGSSLWDAVLSSRQRHNTTTSTCIPSFGFWVPVLKFIVAPHQLCFGVTS